MSTAERVAEPQAPRVPAHRIEDMSWRALSVAALLVAVVGFVLGGMT